MPDSPRSSDLLVKSACSLLESPPKATFCLSSGLPAQELSDLTQEQQAAAEAFFDVALTELSSIPAQIANDLLYLPPDGAPHICGTSVLIEVSLLQLVSFQCHIASGQSNIE